MNLKQLLFLPLALLWCTAAPLQAQSPEADSVDVLHYDLTLDMGHRVAKQLNGRAAITFVITRPCSRVDFDLIADSVRPVSLDGVVTRGFQFDPENNRLSIYVNGNTGDTHEAIIPYVSHGYVESYDFGGMHMDNGIHYNLGAAFREYPHCFGRSTYPCRDNFHDKATYTYRVTSKPGWRSLCSGILESRTRNDDGSLLEVWQLTQPSPTYISSVSSAPWHVIDDTCAGLNGTYPLTLGFTSHDSLAVVRHFAILEQVMPMFERCFGPYRWDRVGYIATPRGSMEHAQNIALVSDCMADVSSTPLIPCQMTTCHELGHAWFGNLITCATAGDMWINEGGASFCEEVANEAIYGRQSATKYYLEKLSEVIRTTHLKDVTYRPLHDMPQQFTYGSTTYDKGAMVWHSIRGLMGDSLFYASMRRLFDRCAFGNIDAEGLRDSLMLYSGIDLTGFFDFHVFGKGFVDYAIADFTAEGHNASLTLRQLLRGTDTYAHGNRVPVTFFSRSLEQSKHWMLFDDNVATQSFQLPFDAAFAVVDYDDELSDACTGGSTNIASRGKHNIDYSYCQIQTQTASENPNAWVHIGHHFAHPGGDTLAGIVRMAPRYWRVVGNIPWESTVQGAFYYAREGYGTTSYIDEGFFTNRATLDSLCLLYRPDAGQPWQAVSHQRTQGSNNSSGHIESRLFEGEYTLAVVDTNLLAVVSPQGGNLPTLRLFPNPATEDFRIDMGSYDKKINLSVFDITGRKVLEQRDLYSNATVRHQLPAGTYIVLIQNKFLSLQSQIIIQ